MNSGVYNHECWTYKKNSRGVEERDEEKGDQKYLVEEIAIVQLQPWQL